MSLEQESMTSISVSEFMAQYKASREKKPSPLEKYVLHIEKMRKEGFPLSAIVKFLNAQGEKVSRQQLRYWLVTRDDVTGLPATIDEAVALSEATRRRSRLEPFESEIRELKARGTGWKAIQAYLRKRGLKIDDRAIARWWNRKTQPATQRPHQANAVTDVAAPARKPASFDLTEQIRAAQARETFKT